MSGGTPLGRMMIELGLDDTSFGKGVEGAKKKVTYLSKEMQANMKIADLAGDKYGKLGVKFDGLTGIISAQQQKVEQLKKSYEGSLVDGKPTEQTAKLATQLQQANGQLASYNKQLANTAGEMAKWKIENEGVTGGLLTFGKGLENIGGQMSSVGDKMTKGVTLPIVAGVGLVTKAAIDWESAFAGVKKTNDEIVDGNGKVVYSYDDLEASLRDLTKVLPATHEEIAAVAEAGGQLGIATENVVGFTKTMIDLGESTNMSAEEAATALARLANITGLPQTEFERLGSVIVDLGNNMATTESEITNMALRLAGAGSQVGMSEAQILSFSAALSSVGIEAEAGGSAFSKVMIEMQLAVEKGVDAFKGLQQVAERNGIAWESVSAAVNKGGKELTAMSNAMGLGNKGLKDMYEVAGDAEQKLADFANVAGISGDEFAKAFKDDAAGAIIQFIEGLGKAEEKGTSAIKVLDDMNITEVRLRDSLLRAAGAGDVFTDAIKMGTKAWDENTALAEEAEKRYETMESQLSMLKNEVKDVAIDLGGPFVEALREGVKVAKPMIENISDLAKKFADADPKTQKMVLKMIAFAAAAGPVLSITGRVASGIGGMTTKTIGFLGVMAQKKTVKDFTAQLLTGSADIIKWNSAATAGATATASFGTAASTASGASGVAGLTGALGALGPVALGIVGVGGVLAVGYGAWKLFGEEAWNSSQRVERWGSDVGSVTEKTLVTIQDNTLKASGEFGLLADGVEGNTPKMIASFEAIGGAIETDLTNQIATFKKAIEMMPDEVREAAQKIDEEFSDKRESALTLVKENNDRIIEIKKKYVDEEGQVTIQGAKMVSDLMRQSTEEYLNITIEDAGERKKVLDAMTGDVEVASEKQAVAWLRSLGKQHSATKQEYAKDLAAFKKHLGDKVNTEEGKQLVKLFEDSARDATLAFENQMAIILEKYPELKDKIVLATGQLASELGGMSEVTAQANEALLKRASEMSGRLADDAKKNANILKWTVDEGTQAGKIWNALELIDKEGNVKTNAAEIVKEATKDTNTWNQMRLVIHDANLDSNAKLIIGEAAIANGWWDGMSWDDKSAVLNSNSNEIIVKAMRDNGSWNELTFEQKKAILYSNTPEKMTETMLNLGLWDKYEPLIKSLKADNLDLFQVLSGSEQMLNKYNQMPIELKKLISDDSGSTPTVKQAQQALKDFSALPVELKKLLSDNTDVMNKLGTAQSTLETYISTNPDPKTLQMLSDLTGYYEYVNAYNQVQDKTVTFRTVYIEENPNNAPPGYAVATREYGTNFHSGGLALVNDQRGPLYRELITLPSGKSFIPEGRDVLLNLPRGSKVNTATDTKKLVPHYEKGVGVPKNAKVIQTMNWLNKATESTVNMKVDNSKLEALLKQVIQTMGTLELKPIINVKNESDLSVIKTYVEHESALDNKVRYF